ncbi:MAG: hypothetical protein KAW45_06800 [Thermoplasmatales archaeon]|nr:hypothetical protein [Thermoplasmatales archaeon]
MHKKITVIGILLLFLSLTIFPVINSQSIEELTLENKSGNSTYDLLILAPKKFKRPLEKLVSHKNSFGMRTNLVTLEYVYNDIWYGRDKAEKVKYFIKDAIEDSGIKYVLLVGGMKNLFTPQEYYWCPVRYVNIVDRWGGSRDWGNYLELKYLSDLYFADIYDSEGNFSSWDTDRDGIYGEWNNNNSAEDVLDLYPDVFVGRLPCRNTIEVRIVVNKIINYEKVDSSDSEWFNKMVVVAGDTYAGGGSEGEEETQAALDMMPDFTHVKLWISNGNFTGPADVKKAFNQGCGFLYFAGHGSPTCWVGRDPETGENIDGLKNAQILTLRNGKKLPICIVGGCHNSMFNISLFHSSWIGKTICFESFSWLLTRKIGGGTIATFGNTALGYGPKDKLDPSSGGGGGNLSAYFFEEIGINGNDILGECWGYAISSHLDNFPILWAENSFNDSSIDVKTVTNWLLMGDPSLKIGGYS